MAYYKLVRDISCKDITKLIKRTQPEIVILSMSALTACTIFPFIFIRLANDQTLTAFVNAVITSAMLLCFIFVYKTRKVNPASLVMSIFVMAAVIIHIKMQGSSSIYWFYPSMIIVYYLSSDKIAVLICTVSMMIIFALLHSLISTVDFLIICVTILLTNIFSFIIFHSYNETQTQLRLLATTDSLTQAGNRRALDRSLSELILSQQRQEYIMCLILLDLDYFKKINDQHGHAIGDEILVAISQLIVKNTRVLDSFYRYGGEEFIIMPLKVDLESAAVIAENLRGIIQNNPYPAAVKVTISLGVAQYQPGESSEDWISRADAALYDAKSTGRNKVCLAN